MNTHQMQLPGSSSWTWGLDDQQAVALIKKTADLSLLTRMAEDVITRKVSPCQAALFALIERMDLPLDSAFRLAKAIPQCEYLAWRFCSRRDATPDMLDEWAGDEKVAFPLGTNPKTRQSTIDKLFLSALQHDTGYCDLLPRVSLPLLEKLAQEIENGGVRCWAGSKTRNQELLWELSGDPDPMVRLSVVTNPFTEDAIINGLAQTEEDMWVLAAAAERVTDQHVLEHLVETLCEVKDKTLAEALLKNPNALDVAKATACLIRLG